MGKVATLLIGNSNLNKESAGVIADCVERIFKSGFENHMEQSTIQSALETLGRLGEVKNVTVSGSSFHGDQNIDLRPPSTTVTKDDDTLEDN